MPKAGGQGKDEAHMRASKPMQRGFISTFAPCRREHSLFLSLEERRDRRGLQQVAAYARQISHCSLLRPGDARSSRKSPPPTHVKSF
jgi:hypothetical protein